MSSILGPPYSHSLFLIQFCAFLVLLTLKSSCCTVSQSYWEECKRTFFKL